MNLELFHRLTQVSQWFINASLWYGIDDELDYCVSCAVAKNTV